MDWNALNSELNDRLKPIHHNLSTDLISPDVAGDQIGYTIRDFLLSKPQFCEDKKSSGFVNHTPSSLRKVTSIKNELRKSARRSEDPAERKKFYQALRAHSYLNKQTKKRNKQKTSSWQETLFHKNFHEFSKSVCNGSFGEESPSPTFDKQKADTFYQNRYAKSTPVNIEELHWFPDVNRPEKFQPFNLKPFTPKDIKNIIRSKSSNSSPGPDGITYGILKKLPCTHHILATLYSKLLSAPKAPSSWSKSKVTLIFKKGESTEPSNFRMIALSSTLGKTFHLLLANRISDYVSANKFIDTEMQKAFMKKINGVIEHNQCLQEVLSHARANKKTVHATFFDLEDAFGSVQHNIISHALLRYNIPPAVHDYILDLYGKLQGTVVTKSWTSETFSFKKGVFQGDPLSPIIFLIVFNPLLEKLKLESKFGYDIQNTKYLSTPFADDFNLLTTNKKTHQRIINNICSWTKSMGLKLKAKKCKSLSIVSGKATPVSFFIEETETETLDKVEENHKFLGSIVTFSGKQSEVFSVLKDHFETRLNRIDSLLVRNEHKVKMYKEYLLPSSRFILSVHNLTSTSLDKLDSLVTKYLKSWLGLPNSATRAVIHSPQLMDIKSVRHLYRESQTNSYINSKLHADSKVKNALQSRLDRESKWQKKQSTIADCETTMTAISIPFTPENSTRIKREAKKSISDEMSETWFTHLRSLVLQGQFLTVANSLNSDFNYKSLIFGLPRNVLKFLTNAAIDTLPTNSNLNRWNKRSCPNCQLCANKETLLHVLNNCNTMLSQGRYTWRHNSVLQHLITKIKAKYDSSEYRIFCDLPGLMTGISTIPTSVIVTNSKPDICLVNDTKKEIVLIELTIPFDTNITAAHERKSLKYEHLKNDIEDKGYSVDLITLEIGSRGLISKENVTKLQKILKLNSSKSRELKTFQNELSKIALISSYCIFYSKFESSWIEPDLIQI